jgi:hypothetical protein
MAAILLAVIVDCAEPESLADFWAVALKYKVAKRNPGEYEASDPAGVGAPLYFMQVPEPKVGKNRLHIDLVTEELLEDEVARLVAAGATFVETRQDPATHANPDRWTVLLDPEGNVFCVTSVATLTGWSTPMPAATT